jgi:MFS family permease
MVLSTSSNFLTRSMRPSLPRTVLALGVVSFFTDVASEMIYPLLPIFLTGVLGASATFVGAIEGAAESASSLLKLASGWWSDRLRRRKPLVVFGYALASAMRPLVAIAESAAQVLVIRVSDRVGKGIRSAPRDALIADSVDASIRGRAFGFHRAADHAGGVLGPLVAFALLGWGNLSMQTLFLLAAIPGAASVVVVVFGVREAPARRSAPTAPVLDLSPRMGARFWAVLGVIFLFTLGNSSDAFLLLRAAQLGVPLEMAPLLWALLHAVKSVASLPGGALSDRIGRRPALLLGWGWYAAVYLGFALASREWHAWALFGVYGLFFGLTEGTERALISDIVPASRRGVAYGWYNLAIGIGILPASALFGVVWDRAGAPVAFSAGALIALAAAVGLLAIRLGGERPAAAES